LALNRTPSFGYDPKSAGGIFQIEHLTYEYADFYFFGLNRDIGRNTKPLIEVARGADSDIRIAVVGKMIAIIRDNVSGDFTWLSQRGPITMSARQSDSRNSSCTTFLPMCVPRAHVIQSSASPAVTPIDAQR
jgi:hypothetical protein